MCIHAHVEHIGEKERDREREGESKEREGGERERKKERRREGERQTDRHDEIDTSTCFSIKSRSLNVGLFLVSSCGPALLL